MSRRRDRKRDRARSASNFRAVLPVLALVLGFLNSFLARAASAEGITARQIPEMISGALNEIVSAIPK